MRVLSCCVRTEEGPCEDIVRGQQSASWERVSSRSQISQNLDLELQIPSLQNYEKMNF